MLLCIEDGDSLPAYSPRQLQLWDALLRCTQIWLHAIAHGSFHISQTMANAWNSDSNSHKDLLIRIMCLRFYWAPFAQSIYAFTYRNSIFSVVLNDDLLDFNRLLKWLSTIFSLHYMQYLHSRMLHIPKLRSTYLNAQELTVPHDYFTLAYSIWINSYYPSSQQPKRQQIAYAPLSCTGRCFKRCNIACMISISDRHDGHDSS